MTISPHAGRRATKDLLVDVARLEREYYARAPDPDDPTQRVSFGTSGHRGSSLRGSFTEAHILAITQAICDYRRAQGIDGPLYLGKDTHALSAPAQRTALEVLAANDVETVIQRDDGVTPTPVISRAILAYNRGAQRALGRRDRRDPIAQPARGRRLQVQPAARGPGRQRRDALGTGARQRSPAERQRRREADPDRRRAGRADDASRGLRPAVRERSRGTSSTWTRSGRRASRSRSTRSAAPPSHYWEPINSVYGLDIQVVNPKVDPTFSFMTVDHDGAIRMDCSSPYAMARLVGLKDRYRVAFANDPDADRHGIVTPSAGLLNPNHYLAVAIHYPRVAPPELARARGDRQDAGLEQHDRPRGERSRADAVRGAGRLQVVRARPVRRLVLLRQARRAPAPASCAATAACGPPTKTA